MTALSARSCYATGRIVKNTYRRDCRIIAERLACFEEIYANGGGVVGWELLPVADSTRLGILLGESPGKSEHTGPSGLGLGVRLTPSHCDLLVFDLK